MNSTLHRCSGWAEVRDLFDSFPHQNFGYDLDGGLGETSWVFRGHKSFQYGLAPKIERQLECGLPWAALESKVVLEFQSRARMFFNPSDVPDSSDKLGWLALMQHYGFPTRLIDFTFSPYIALYFSVVDRNPEERGFPAQVWAINTRPLMKNAFRKFYEAKREQAKINRSKAPESQKGASLDTRTFSSEREEIEDDTESRYRMLNETLAPDGIFRDCFNKSGFVALALPRVQNRRLSSQQGVFLFTGAEDRVFQDSLELIMNDHKTEWCKRVEIAADAAMYIERQLLRMNIHHLSLFPDIEGLAGFIRQKTRLHWAPSESPFILEEWDG